MKNFDYSVKLAEENTVQQESMLDSMGADGWECFSVIPSSIANGVVFYFRKPVIVPSSTVVQNPIAPSKPKKEDRGK